MGQTSQVCSAAYLRLNTGLLSTVPTVSKAARICFVFFFFLSKKSF